MALILIVDDERAFAEGMSELLKDRGHECRLAEGVAEARKALESGVPDAAIVDLMLPDGSGLDVLEAFRDQRPRQIFIVTGHSGVRDLIGGMAGEGVHYLRKPIEARDLEGLLNALDAGEASGEETAPDDTGFGLLLGESPAMRDLFKQIRRVAKTRSTVLIQGESGSGKELVAEMIHRESERSGRYIPVNCGALSRDLISSQLFGHERGSFTGAERRHQGVFERADGGTLLLDEITEMPLEHQAQLLRVLETGAVTRLGSEAPVEVDTRLLAATNRDPSRAIEDDKLREDLYFRLNVFPLHIPPLREREGDVALLARHFVDALNEEAGSNKVLSDRSLRALEQHRWPGNVRELKHAVHRAFIMADDSSIEMAGSFDDVPIQQFQGLTVGRSIADVERDLIVNTLEHFDGNRKKTAATLDISLKTLYNRLKAYGEDDPED